MPFYILGNLDTGRNEIVYGESWADVRAQYLDPKQGSGSYHAVTNKEFTSAEAAQDFLNIGESPSVKPNLPRPDVGPAGTGVGGVDNLLKKVKGQAARAKAEAEKDATRRSRAADDPIAETDQTRDANAESDAKKKNKPRPKQSAADTVKATLAEANTFGGDAKTDGLARSNQELIGDRAGHLNEVSQSSLAPAAPEAPPRGNPNVTSLFDGIGTVTVAGTGHRPDKFLKHLGRDAMYDPQNLDRGVGVVKDFLRSNFLDRGQRVRVVTGMAQGFDTMLGVAAAQLKREGHAVNLIAAVPFRGQADTWGAKAQTWYQTLLRRSDEVHYLHDTKPGDRMGVIKSLFRRNDFMVQGSDLILAAWRGDPTGGTAGTIRSAQHLGRPIYNLYDQIADAIGIPMENRQVTGEPNRWSPATMHGAFWEPPSGHTPMDVTGTITAERSLANRVFATEAEARQWASGYRNPVVRQIDAGWLATVPATSNRILNPNLDQRIRLGGAFAVVDVFNPVPGSRVAVPAESGLTRVGSGASLRGGESRSFSVSARALTPEGLQSLSEAGLTYDVKAFRTREQREEHLGRLERDRISQANRTSSGDSHDGRRGFQRSVGEDGFEGTMRNLADQADGYDPDDVIGSDRTPRSDRTGPSQTSRVERVVGTFRTNPVTGGHLQAGSSDHYLQALEVAQSRSGIVRKKFDTVEFAETDSVTGKSSSFTADVPYYEVHSRQQLAYDIATGTRSVRRLPFKPGTRTFTTPQEADVSDWEAKRLADEMAEASRTDPKRKRKGFSSGEETAPARVHIKKRMLLDGGLLRYENGEAVPEATQKRRLREIKKFMEQNQHPQVTAALQGASDAEKLIMFQEHLDPRPRSAAEPGIPVDAPGTATAMAPSQPPEMPAGGARSAPTGEISRPLPAQPSGPATALPRPTAPPTPGGADTPRSGPKQAPSASTTRRSGGTPPVTPAPIDPAVLMLPERSVSHPEAPVLRPDLGLNTLSANAIGPVKTAGPTFHVTQAPPFDNSNTKTPSIGLRRPPPVRPTPVSPARQHLMGVENAAAAFRGSLPHAATGFLGQTVIGATLGLAMTGGFNRQSGETDRRGTVQAVAEASVLGVVGSTTLGAHAMRSNVLSRDELARREMLYNIAGGAIGAPLASRLAERVVGRGLGNGVATRLPGFTSPVVREAVARGIGPSSGRLAGTLAGIATWVGVSVAASLAFARLREDSQSRIADHDFGMIGEMNQAMDRSARLAEMAADEYEVMFADEDGEELELEGDFEDLSDIDGVEDAHGEPQPFEATINQGNPFVTPAQFQFERG